MSMLGLIVLVIYIIFIIIIIIIIIYILYLYCVFLFMRGYSLNRRAYALFKVLLMCVFQFKSVSRCKPRYLTGVSLSVVNQNVGYVLV
jgi:hypothetical protein